MPNESVSPDEDKRTVTYTGTPAHVSDDPAVWGQFRDLKRIGGGGFGAVYRAWDTQLHREVALKLLLPRNGQTDEADAVQEARMMARVRHPGIVPVYGVAVSGGRVGFWSELVDGPSLAAVVRDSGPLGPRAAANAVAELCKAVSAMHATGILHRDIKAENVLRDSNGRILLTDFGLSRDPETKFFGGTRDYMAPELLKGYPHTPASDVYALGVLLCVLATGKFPDSKPTLPRGLAEIVSRAHAAQPETRYGSAQGMQVALEAWLATAPSRTKRSRGLWIAAMGGVLLLAAVLWFSLRGASRTATNLYDQAHTLMQRRDRSANVLKAAELLGDAVKADPKFALAHAELATALWEQYRRSRDPKLRDQAVSEVERAVALDSESAAVFAVAGRIHAGTGKRALAASDFGRALKLDERNADVYRELGQLYDAEGRDADAERAFQKAIDLDPDNWLNFDWRGKWLLARGRLEEAEKDFQHELRIAPDNAWAHIQLGRMRMDQDRLNDARAELQQAIRLAPDEPNAYTNFGFLLMQEGKFDDAANQFAHETQLTPSRYLPWGNLASATQFSGKGIQRARPIYLKAIQLARIAHRENPSDSLLTATLGGYEAAAGDRNAALDSLGQAVARAPQNAAVLLNAGEGYEILGMRAKAIPLVEEALRRGYPVRIVKQSPDLAQLLSDVKFRWPNAPGR